VKLNFKHFNLDDATLFVKKVGKNVVYIVVYVDDMLIIGNDERYIALQGCRPIDKCRVNGRKYVKEVSRSILTLIYPEACLRVMRFSLGVIRQPTGFDPVSREYDTCRVTDSPSHKKKNCCWDSF
jgi:hypothetical protein